MAEQSMFWAGKIAEGAAGDAGPYTDTQFAELVKALMEDRTGVVSGLAVIASSPAGANVTVTAGKAVIRGRLYWLNTDQTVDINDNTSGNPRIDRVVLQADYAAQTIRLVALEGTPAGSPSAPTVTETDNVLWELSLSTVAVANGFSTITDSNITRDRVWARDEAPGDTHDSFNPNLESTGRYLKADGRAISRATYRDLFDAIGTAHGVGDGSTTFNIPDLRGRTFAGMDNMGTAAGSANVVTNAAADSVGGAMGEENHALTSAENGPHTHGYSQGLMSANFGGGSSNAQVDGGAVDDTTASSGSGTPHNTMQPTRFGYAYIRV